MRAEAAGGSADESHPASVQRIQTLRAALIVVAAGTGSRLAAGEHKALVDLGGRPLVEHSLRRLLSLQALDPVVLVGHEEDHAVLAALLASLPRHVTLVNGGARRQDSVAAGLAALPGDIGIVLVHDAARPFVPVERLPDLIRQAARTGAALLAVPVADTIKEARAPEAPATADSARTLRPAEADTPLVARTVPRDRLWAAQTPQAFQMSTLARLLADAAARDLSVTDEAALFEAAGLPVAFVEGSRINFKITTAEDLAFARSLLVQLEGGHR